MKFSSLANPFRSTPVPAALGLLAVMVANPASAALVSYTFGTANTGTATSDLAPSVQDPLVSGSSFDIHFAGGQTNPLQFGRSSFSANVFVRVGQGQPETSNTSLGFLQTTEADAVNFNSGAGQFFGFTVTPDANYQLDLTKLTFDFGGQTQGGSVNEPFDAHYAVYTSVDGFTVGQSVASGSKSLSGSAASFDAIDIDLSASAFDALQSPFETRVYVWATASVSKPYANRNVNNIIRLDNIALEGAAAPVPEPTSLLAGGMIALPCLRRRRLP